MIKKLFIFDLDGTLAESKQPLANDMAETLCRLMQVAHVGIVSGANFGQFENQFIQHLPCLDLFEHLHIMPTNGAQYYSYKKADKEWIQVYSTFLLLDEKMHIIETIKKVLREIDFPMPAVLYGEQIEDRGSQISYSFNGQQAPISVKENFDLDKSKRLMIRDKLLPLLPGFTIAVGGMNTIDIIREGIDKAYAINELSARLQIEKEDIVYLGDAIFPGGNDYAATKAGVETVLVQNPDDTRRKIEDLLHNK
jgi:phosphomannomutase